MASIDKLTELELGHIKILIQGGSEKKFHAEVVEMPPFSYTMTAARETLNHIRSFENPVSDFSFHGGIQYAMTVLHWSLAVESCVSSIIHIFNKYGSGKVDFIDTKNRYLTDVCCQIVENINPCYVKKFRKLFERDLRDLWRVRNSIAHSLIWRYDNNRGENIAGHASRLFNDNPFLMGMVDVLESTRIAVRVFILFRYSLKYFDLMPSIPLAAEDRVVFVKADRFYKTVLSSVFFRTLNKHGLETKHDLKLGEVHAIGHLNLQYLDCNAIIYADHVHEVNLSNKKTSYLKNAINCLVRDSPKNSISLPDQRAIWNI